VRSPDSVVTGLRPAASLYAITRSLWAWAATASASWNTPLITVPGGNPVTELPGLTPRSPLIVLGPVLDTVEPASTAKLAAVPSPTGAWAARAPGAPANTTATATASTPVTARGAASAEERRRAPNRRGHTNLDVIESPSGFGGGPTDAARARRDGSGQRASGSCGLISETGSNIAASPERW